MNAAVKIPYRSFQKVEQIEHKTYDALNLNRFDRSTAGIRRNISDRNGVLNPTSSYAG